MPAAVHKLTPVPEQSPGKVPVPPPPPEPRPPRACSSSPGTARVHRRGRYVLEIFSGCAYLSG
eukprot:1827578-Heterocapsa_arctica.AAC.1